MKKVVAVVWMVCGLGMIFEASGQDKKTDEKPPTEKAASGNYDEVYVTEAATKDKIPHPLSKNTETVRYKGKKIEVPERMVFVPEGEFLMGKGQNEHKVWLDSYCIGKFEVTNAEWKAFIDATNFRPFPNHWKAGDPPEGKENHPVVCVSWEDAQKYCEWVKQGTGLEVRLPTDAEWEKAASWNPKKKQKLMYPWGNQWDPKQCNSQAMLERYGFHPNDEAEDWGKRWAAWEKTEKAKEIMQSGGNTLSVGSFKRVGSFYGCWDTVGNVREWCQDWFKMDYYLLKDAKKNPQGPGEDEAEEVVAGSYKGKARVVRGGSWFGFSSYCNSVSRWNSSPSTRTPYIGFRVALSSGRP